MQKMLQIRIYKLLLVLAIISFGRVTFATRVDDISKQLRCLMCDNQSVFDSSSDFSVKVKDDISRYVDLGLNDESIISNLRSDYGNDISLANDISNVTPVIAVVLFIIIAGWVVLRNV